MSTVSILMDGVGTHWVECTNQNRTGFFNSWMSQRALRGNELGKYVLWLMGGNCGSGIQMFSKYDTEWVFCGRNSFLWSLSHTKVGMCCFWFSISLQCVLYREADLIHFDLSPSFHWIVKWRYSAENGQSKNVCKNHYSASILLGYNLTRTLN